MSFNYVSTAPLAAWEINVLKTRAPFRVTEKTEGVCSLTRWEEYRAGDCCVLVVRSVYEGGAWRVEWVQRAEYGRAIEGSENLSLCRRSERGAPWE
jgi:hypothetical protein